MLFPFFFLLLQIPPVKFARRVKVGEIFYRAVEIFYCTFRVPFTAVRILWFLFSFPLPPYKFASENSMRKGRKEKRETNVQVPAAEFHSQFKILSLSLSLSSHVLHSLHPHLFLLHFSLFYSFFTFAS